MTDAPRWALYCGPDLIYQTRDPEDAQSWVDADPADHTARPVPADSPAPD